MTKDAFDAKNTKTQTHGKKTGPATGAGEAQHG